MLNVGVVDKELLVGRSVLGALAFVEPTNKTLVSYEFAVGRFNGVAGSEDLVDGFKDSFGLSGVRSYVSSTIFGFGPTDTVSRGYTELVEQVPDLKASNQAGLTPTVCGDKYVDSGFAFGGFTEVFNLSTMQWHPK